MVGNPSLTGVMEGLPVTRAQSQEALATTDFFVREAGPALRKGSCCFRISQGGREAKLLHKRQKIRDPPMVGDLAVAYAHDVYGLELDLAPCRRQSPECPFMCTVVGFIRCHAIAIGNLPMDLRVKIRKRGAKCAV